MVGDAERIWEQDSQASIPGFTARDVGKAFSYLHLINEMQHPLDLSNFPKGVLTEHPKNHWTWHKPNGFVIQWTWTDQGQAADVRISKKE